MIQALIAGVGLATSLFGASKARKAEKKAARVQAETSRKSLAISNQISNQEQAAADEAYNASVQVSNFTKQQEALRKDQMINESMSQTRSIIRETQLARATGTARAAAGGALNSTGYFGAQAGAQAAGDEQATTLFGNTQRALRNFSINEAILNTQVASQGVIAGYNRTANQLRTQLNEVQTLGGNQAAKAQSNANTGRSIFSLGTQITGSAETSGNVSKSLFKL